ncbi:UNVERIFIED_CONTAM: hypothetical protein Sradi_5092100 [Sesamum radiatum]|uniref:Uncharacterized protein n=1 Tax=Sesamum radiatum TaxID=300843 RepID=A0AAW2M276_SESRA
MHKVAMTEEGTVKRGHDFRIDKRMINGMKKYRLMAVTSNPQSGVVPLRSHSVYGNITTWILIVQIIGMLVGTIVYLCRWFTAVRFKCLTTCHRISFREELKIEAHWIQTLVYWRDSFSDNDGYRQQATSLIPALLVTPFILFFKKLKAQLLSRLTTSNNDIRSESGGDTELNLDRFVLLLDGEAELPEKTVKNICAQADKVIEMGKEQQPQNLIHLLNRFDNFSGRRHLLPNVANNYKATQLMSSVSEGLSLVKLIEKTLHENDELLNIRNATDVSWAGVALYGKWQRIDLRRITLKCKTSKNVLQELSSNAERTMVEFKKTKNNVLMDNPLNWPTNIIAANSMYRICQTILLSCQEGTEQTDDGLFERLYIMIADILAACFTNLPCVIITKCHSNSIEERGRASTKRFSSFVKRDKFFNFFKDKNGHLWIMIKQHTLKSGTIHSCIVMIIL